MSLPRTPFADCDQDHFAVYQVITHLNSRFQAGHLSILPVNELEALRAVADDQPMPIDFPERVHRRRRASCLAVCSTVARLDGVRPRSPEASCQIPALGVWGAEPISERPSQSHILSLSRGLFVLLQEPAKVIRLLVGGLVQG